MEVPSKYLFRSLYTTNKPTQKGRFVRSSAAALSLRALLRKRSVAELGSHTPARRMVGAGAYDSPFLPKIFRVVEGADPYGQTRNVQITGKAEMPRCP